MERGSRNMKKILILEISPRRRRKLTPAAATELSVSPEKMNLHLPPVAFPGSWLKKRRELLSL
jgi:hypothetical protein